MSSQETFPIDKADSRTWSSHAQRPKRAGEAGTRRKPPDQADPEQGDARGDQEPHEARATATPETEETEEDAPGAETRAAGQGGETGPNEAKTENRAASLVPAARADETTRASPPRAHPTATPRPPGAPRTEPTTPETSDETEPDAGRAREPQKPTTPDKRPPPKEKQQRQSHQPLEREMKPPPARRAVKSAGHRRPRKGKRCLGEKFCGANRLRRRRSCRVFGDPCGDDWRRYTSRPGGGFRAWRLASDFWGRAGEGVWRSPNWSFHSGSKPPSRTLRLWMGFDSGGLEERLHRRGRRLGEFRLDSEATSVHPRQLP